MPEIINEGKPEWEDIIKHYGYEEDKDARAKEYERRSKLSAAARWGASTTLTYRHPTGHSIEISYSGGYGGPADLEHTSTTGEKKHITTRQGLYKHLDKVHGAEEYPGETKPKSLVGPGGRFRS